MSEVKLAVEPRTEFGKGAARRTRRAGKIPAVLYGHGADPKHLSLPMIEFARIVRDQGYNAVLTLQIDGKAELALTKAITTHPLRNYIEHVDLLVIRRGEKVTVDISVLVHGEPATGAVYYQELDHLSIEADVLTIPDNVEISVADLPIGTQIHASDVALPPRVTLVTEGDYLVVNVTGAPTAEEMESEIDTEGAGVVEDESEDETETSPTDSAAEDAAEE
ncbi:MAG: 50S ribosomal protein L25/general stress protein Ctc [Sciscionella sp.]